MQRLTTLFRTCGLLCSLVFATTVAHAQTGIGTTTPDPSSRLDVVSTSKGMLVPRMTTAQRDAIVDPAQGLVVYNTESNCLNYFDAASGAWIGVGCDAQPTTVTGVIDCSSASVQGTYQVGRALTSDNTLTVSINFDGPGAYTIKTTANGMTFSAVDTVLSAGVRTVVMQGTGTPGVAGTTSIVVSFGSDNCTLIVNVQESVATLASCPTAGTQVGTVVANAATSGVTVPLTFTYTGGRLYSLTTSANNGIRLSGAASGELDISPAVVSVGITGTPVIPGNTTLSYDVNARTGCSVIVPVTSGTGRASAISCAGTLSGTYTSTTALTASNTKVVTLTVTTAGQFYVRTAAVNGVYFQGTATLALGSQNMTLTAVGTPSAPGTFTYTPIVSATNTTFAQCTFTVTYTSPPTLPNYTTITCGATGPAYSYIKASNTDVDDNFGITVAVSGNGLTLAVGAPYEDGSGTGINPTSNNSLNNAGALYIYTRTSTASNWTFQAYIKASNSGGGDYFGQGVAISNDGNTVAVGARFEDGSGTGINPTQNNSAADAGAVYVFSRTGSTWSQQAYIKASNAEAGDRFGLNISLSSDGNTLAVGADTEDGSGTGINPAHNNSSSAAGAAYVFSRTGSTWSQQAYIKASNTNAEDRFGNNVALSGDGNTLAVSAIYEDGSGTGINPANNNSATDAGAVYVYTRTGSTWAFQVYIKASNTGASDQFGFSVQLTSDGNTLAVGALVEDGSGTGINPANNNSSSGSGAVYVFTRAGSTWSQQAYIKASNTGAGDQFGVSIALSSNGTTLAVGAQKEDSSNGCINGADNNSSVDAGAVYVFTRTGTTWIQQAVVRPGTPGAGDGLGASVSISADGKVLAIGAPYEDGSSTGVNPAVNNSATNAGGVYVYTGN